jgi:hypothetical protein
MSRNPTGEKATATKAERRHAAAVDRAIKAPGPANTARTHETFNHLHRSSTRHDQRQGR